MNEREPETFDFDVFLSHSSKDKSVVRALAERLRRDGLKVWFDEWEIALGEPIFARVQYGLERSRFLFLFMSRNAFGSDWVTLEHQSLLFRDPLNRDRRFIPLLLDDAELPTVLRQFKYLDWRTPADEAYQALLLACRAARPPGTRPRSKRGPPSHYPKASYEQDKSPHQPIADKAHC